MFQNALIVKMNENVCHDTALMLESLDDVIKYMLECNYNIFTKNHDVFIIYFERTIWCITKLSTKFVDIFMFTLWYEICFILHIICVYRLAFSLKPFPIQSVNTANVMW